MSKYDGDPSWVDPDNDPPTANDEDEEQMPLFGTGKLSLASPAVDQKGESKANYGSVDEEEVSEETPRLAHHEDPFVADEAEDISTITGGDFEQSNKPTAPPMPQTPRQNPCLWLFHLIEGIAVIAFLCIVTIQALPLFLTSVRNIGILELGLKAYISFFCLLFIMVELDVPIGWLRDSSLLSIYFSRGFIYSFVGLICLEQSFSERVKDVIYHAKDDFHVAWVPLFMQISSSFVLGIGMLYMLLGTCCLKRLRDSMKRREKEEWKEFRRAMREYRDNVP